MFHHQIEKETIPDAAKNTSEKLHRIWEKANIPVKAEHNIRRNITNLHGEFCKLKKDAKRENPSAVTRRELWKSDLDDIFDIARGNIGTLSVPEEDFKFLELQREDRQSFSLGGMNKVQASVLAKQNEGIERHN